MSQRHTDAALLEAARQCVAERGISRATVSDVARRAGASRMTVYRTFPDAASLWSTLLTREVATVIEASRQAVAALPTARQRLVAATGAALGALRHDPVIRRVIELDGALLLPYLTVRRGRAQGLAIAAFAELLDEGREDGSIRSLDTGAASRLLELLARALVAAAPALLADSDAAAIDRELETMIDAYLRPRP